MFESAELKHTVDAATYARKVAQLRAKLLDAQYQLLERKTFSVLILVNGVDGAGKGETVNLFNEWMDPRHIRSTAFGEPSPEEKARPPMWRYWQALPRDGKIGILFGSWYSSPIIRRAEGKLSKGELGSELTYIRRLERMLVDERTLIVKFWFHLSKKAQRERLESLESNKLTRWRVTKADWKNHARYDRFRAVTEPILRETSSGEAPWVVIDGWCPNYRALTAGTVLLRAMQQALANDDEAASGKSVKKASKSNKKAPSNVPVAGSEAASLVEAVDTRRILTDLKFEERLSKEKYATKIEKVQGELALLSRSPKMKAHSVVVAFEGMDAAGKGGAIRRVTHALDARIYDVIPIAAPTDEEKARPYLWRFWRHIPTKGRFVLYDRSWYGRVLVERVEGLAPEKAWTRAYSEINDFEEQLTDSGIILLKFWLAITEKEQLRRFQEREKTKFKQYKITPDDWRNRKRWDDYVSAASDMIDRTSTAASPWTIIEADDKHLARVRVIETICNRIKQAF